MSDVVFDVGNRPALDSGDAEALADLLAAERNAAARRLSRRIGDAARTPGDVGTSIEIELDPAERRVLAELLEAIRIDGVPVSWRKLRDELRRLRGNS